MLVLLGISELLGMSLWFSASAASTELGGRWSLSAGQIAWLTSTVQLGFVLGTATSAVLNLADIVPSRRLFAGAAVLGALANAGLLVARDYGDAMLCRVATGFFLAGVYPPAMKMIATWFRARRGMAVGTIVGALTLGKATPYLVQSLPAHGVEAVVLVASSGALLAALLVGLWYHDGPYPFPSRPFSLRLVRTVVSVRRWRLATGGYLGHMFELYSAWTWLPAFAFASLTAAGHAPPRASTLASAIAFLAIGIGAAGCLWGGLAGDRRGREWVVTVSMAASGACAMLIGLTHGRLPVLLLLLALVWGFFVIADSAQFSVLVAESVPAHAAGTALTLQTCLGFLLTMFSIQLVPPLVSWIGWEWAFATLALGPAAGIWAIDRLRRSREPVTA